ncbi:MAG TPA: hypothetical protein VGO58_16175 [Chitinophagaceae bacterium]|jgi:hypothetical protein|nr:hypothetical protein [Chitinophagaceae bacterium]
MTAAKDYLQTNRAALFDWIVLVTSFLLGFAFPSLKDLVTSPGFFNWMLASLLLYIAGAALKHLPLSYRLTHSGKTIKPVPYIIFLIVGHWFIILFLVILSESAIRNLFQLAPLTDKNAASWQLITGALVTASFVTWLVYRSKSNRKKRKKYKEGFLFWMEMMADILLIAGVSIFSFIFWEKGVMAMLGKAPAKTMGDIWFLFVFLSILFLFFYLPLRYLFFIEDRERGRNRRRLLLIFAFILIKAIIEMIGI